VPADWRVVGTGDLNGDGISDIVWLQQSTRQVLVWLMGSAGSMASTVPVGRFGPADLVFLVGDINGDGRDDIVLYSPSSDTLGAVVGIGGATFTYRGIGVLPGTAGWLPVALADVNGDHIKDIVWFRAADGTVAVWRMAPTLMFDTLFPAAVGPGSSWRIYKAGDFDGDGREDLFWRNESDGTNAIWFFPGGRAPTANFLVGTPVAQWRLDTVGDFDEDGRDDLVWYDTTSGAVVRWRMQGRGVSPIPESVTGVGPGWTAVQ